MISQGVKGEWERCASSSSEAVTNEAGICLRVKGATLMLDGVGDTVLRVNEDFLSLNLPIGNTAQEDDDV